MRKIILFIASSLDRYIARENTKREYVFRVGQFYRFAPINNDDE